MTVIGEVLASPTLECITNDLPSGDTAYCCRYVLITRAVQVGVEQLNRCTQFDGLVVRRKADRDRHQLVIRGDIEQFSAVRVPAYLRAAIDRDPHAVDSGTGKRPDIDFKATGPVRLVGDPCSVWRKLGETFVELRLEDRERFVAVSPSGSAQMSKPRFGSRLSYSRKPPSADQSIGNFVLRGRE